MQDHKAKLLQLGKGYQNMVLLVGDLVEEALVSEFEQFFPTRIFRFGKGERNMLTAAAGFCLAGKLPVVLGEDLLEKGLEQVVKVLAAARMNVRLVSFGRAVTVDNLKIVKDLEEFEKSFEEYGVIVLQELM